MFHRALLLLPAALSLAPVLHAEPPAADESDAPQFIRVLRDDRGRATALQTAIVHYVPQGTEPVAEADAAINRTDAQGDTPLHKAAAGGHIDTVKLLLEQGAQVDVENKEGLTPLHRAAEGGHTDVIRLLVEARKTQPELRVDLVSAVHIGEQSYYKELNRRFRDYGALLYELVAPEGTTVPADAAERTPGSAVGMMQVGMTDLLELDFQLHHIDYQATNFVHADMTPEEFAKSMKDKNESFFTMMLKSIGQGIAQQSEPGKGGDAAIFMAFFSDNRSLALKRAMADQFENMEKQMAVFDGPEGSTIITERNKKALAVLKKQLDGGQRVLGIFYGAGHMPDMHERLVNEFKMKPVKTEWVTAWEMDE